VPLISDGEYQYEYDDFVKAIGALDTSKPARDSVQDLIDREMAIDNPFMPAPNGQPQKVAGLTTGSGQPLPPPPISATPPPVPPPLPPTKSPVKIATPQYIRFDRDEEGNDQLNQDFIKFLFFEQINGVALLSLTNSAKLDTGTISYQPIANMAETIRALNPKKIIALQNTSDTYFLNFPIKLETKIPDEGNGPNGTNVYREDQVGIWPMDLDPRRGAIIIEAINLGVRENIEIQTLQNGTIYKTNLGNEES
jgi:hypothetical protein